MTSFWAPFTNLAVRAFSPLVSAGGRSFSRWWRRHQIHRSSGEKFSVLVSRIGGDNPANSNQSNICEAIANAMPELGVYTWPEEWVLPDGEQGAAATAAYQTARRWLKSKRCDLLITGRMKSETVISLKFIPSLVAQSSQPLRALTKEPRDTQTYALPLDTMDLPASFVGDLSSALAACVFSNLSQYLLVGYSDAIERVTIQVERLAETTTVASDPVMRARLINCYATGHALLFELGGRHENIQAAIAGFEKSCLTLDPRENVAQWSRAKLNLGAAIARLGATGDDRETLNVALQAMLDALPGLPRELTLWTRAQLNLGSLYYMLSRVTGSKSRLQSSLEVCHQLITNELRDGEPTLWASVQNQYGIGLTALAEIEAGDDALTRALEAFTDALDVWTDQYPLMRAATLINLSQALIALGARQSTLNGYIEATHHLREAQRLISKRDHPLLWLVLQNNLGLSLAMAADKDPDKYYEPIAILRKARDSDAKADRQTSCRISLSLAKALAFFGKHADNISALKESVTILEGLKEISDPALRGEVWNNLGAFYQFLGKVTDELDYFEKSRDVLRELLDHADTRQSPFVLFRTQQSLGVALTEIGSRTASISILNEATHNVLGGLTFTSREASPVTWAAVQTHLAGTYLAITKLNGGQEPLELAQTAISEALSVLGPSFSGSLTIEARELAERIREESGRLTQ
jgi:tetratricopeptide (TPR) repeat protein